MTVNFHLETEFEHYISRKISELGESGDWQVSPDDTGYDRADALYMPDFVDYLKDTAPEKIEKMKKNFGANWLGNLQKKLVSSLETEGTVQTLRKGFAWAGYQTIECSSRYPNDKRLPNAERNYNANILRVMHQVYYQTAGDRSIDLVFFINGIPVATAEIKTELTQTMKDAVQEYKDLRRPIEPDTRRKNMLFTYKRGAVVHFAISEDEIQMCTKLDGDNSVFLPFNKGRSDGHKGNDPMKPGDTEYPTGYFWNDICQKKNWLCIFHDFIFEEKHQVEDATGRLRESRTQIFPRYHQWHAVTECINDVCRSGVGNRYLIEHSAGSGKTETISWTAHELTRLYDGDERLFSSVIIVTDRVGLDSNIKGTIKQLCTTPGFLAMIGGDGDKRSTNAKNKQLADALHNKRAIVVVTLQTFPYAMKSIAEDKALSGMNFAVLVDEAHSSQTGQFAGKMKTALKLASKKKQKETGEDAPEVSTEELMNAFYEQMQKDRTWPENVSFFAYTATPKAETKTLFGRDSGKIDEATGRPIPESFDLYPMRQAIEEGYILDVLKGYMPYKTAYKLKEDIVPETLVDERNAMRTIAHWQSLHPTNVMQKTEFIIEHFVKNVAALLEGQAKAMIVTSSRPAVIRYKYAIEAYLASHPEYDANKVTAALRFKVPGEPLVAFSGKVRGQDAVMPEDEQIVSEIDYLSENPFAAIRTDYDYTEENTNNIGMQKVEKAFNAPDKRIMIVCNKFQTGFNQKKLCAMYIDKVLSNDVEIVQTYSRLNRVSPGKDHVFIIDFVNDPETVERAFKKYDTGARMEHAQRLEVIYEIKKKLDDSDLYTQDELEQYKKARYQSIAMQDGANDALKLRDALRKKMYQTVSAPADRWNNAMKAYANAAATWQETKKEAEAKGNTELANSAKAKLAEIQKEIDKLNDFRKLLKRYGSAYMFISQIVELGEPDMEIFYGFSRLLLKKLDGLPVDEIDISSLVLSDYRLNPLDTENDGDGDDDAVLRPMGGGTKSSKHQKKSLKEIVSKINEAFGTTVSATDGARTINAIVDSVSADNVSRIQIRNSTNSREAIIADGRLESIIKMAALTLKHNELGKLAAQILEDPQAIRPIQELIYDLVNKKKHLPIEDISKYENRNK